MDGKKYIEGRELALAAARFADEKQAENVLVLDLTGISTVADFLFSVRAVPLLI